MRNFTFKRQLLFVMFMLLGCLSIQAADEGLITKQITIKLDKAGTLPNRISSSKMYLITNLKIVGEVNGKDLRLIRMMAGCDFYMKKTDGKLSILDLSDAKIVKSTDSYVWDGGDQNGSNDELGYSVFKGCSVLTSVTIPSSVTSIGGSAFEGCSGLTSVTIPSSVTEIGGAAFKGCSGLTSVTIPSSVTSIGGSTFSGCSGLTSLTLPSGVTWIGGATFSGCSSLTSLTLPSGVTLIGDYAFSGCSGLTSLTLSSGVTSIGKYAFSGCSGLTSLTLPSGVTSIGRYAFSGCSGLTSLTLSSGVTSIGYSAFSGCSGLKYIRCQINDEIETYLSKGHPFIPVECGIEYYLNDKKITSVVIPSTITELGKYAFQNCRDLTSVYVSWSVPNSVNSASSAFSGVDISKITLYVPQGTETDYFFADVWGDFGKIVEFDATGIDKVTTSNDTKELSRYSVNGQRLSAPAKGLNIVKYSDGSVKKVVVQ